MMILFSGTAHSQVRHALVIGIDSYVSVPTLEKARNDALAVHDVLITAGFRSELLLDPDQLALLTAVNDLAGRVVPGDEVVFYFAGHGVEIHGRNFLLPADVPQALPGGEFLVTSRALALDTVLDLLRSRGARVSLLIVDACRDNPFPRQGTRSLGGSRGLGRVEGAPEGTFILFSAGNGQTALDRLSDHDSNPNSVFTRILLPRLSEPGIPVHELAREVRTAVRQLARTVGHDQFPAVYDQFDGDFTLVAAALPVAAPIQEAPAPATDPCVAIVPIWTIMEQSSDPEALIAFADAYGGSCAALSVLARNRATDLQRLQPTDTTELPDTPPPMLPSVELPYAHIRPTIEEGAGPQPLSAASPQAAPAPALEGAQQAVAPPTTPAAPTHLMDVQLTQAELDHIRIVLAQYEARAERIDLRSANSDSLLSERERDVLARFNVIERGIGAPLHALSQRTLTRDAADALLARPLRASQPVSRDRVDMIRSRDWASYYLHSRCAVSTIAQSVSVPFYPVVPELRISMDRYGNNLGSRGRMEWNLAIPHQFRTHNVGDSIWADIDGRRSIVVRGGVRDGYQILIPASTEAFLRDMMRGQFLDVSGHDLFTGETTTVRYSLIGFSAALRRAADMCSRPDVLPP